MNLLRVAVKLRPAFNHIRTGFNSSLIHSRHGVQTSLWPPTTFPYPRLSSNKAPKEPSPKQSAIVKALEKNNVVVSARPGSGKTATARFVAKKNPKTKILILTYSKNLQLKTRSGMSPADKKHVDICTFHGFATDIFKTVVNSDQRLRELRTQGARPKQIPHYQIIVLDELQDLTPDLYWLVCTLLAELARLLHHAPRVLVLGDSRQAIYDYQNADARFLEQAPDLFSEYCPDPWLSLPLRTSFRMTHETTNLVNMCTGDNYIDGSRSGPKPMYIIANVWDHNSLADKLLPLIEQFSPQNCAIIAPSAKRNGPIARLTNLLSAVHGIPVAEPVFDEGRLNFKALKGKLAVATYHQFKGDERELVIVYGAEASYFSQLYGRYLPKDKCPNAIFVALTRAKSQLVIVQSHQGSPLPFVQPEFLAACDVVRLPLQHKSDSSKSPQKRTAVTDLIRHIQPYKLMKLVGEHVRIDKLPPGAKPLNISDTVPTDKILDHHEVVNDISGVAVTADLEWEARGTCTPFRCYQDQHPNLWPKNGSLSAHWLTRRATEYCAKQSYYQSRMFQMQSHSYGWLDKDIYEIRRRLKGQFHDMTLLTFEESFQAPVKVEEGEEPIILTGITDVIERGQTEDDPSTIWEIKLVSSLSLSYVAQLVIYSFLWYNSQILQSGSMSRSFPKLVLFNVCNSERWEISTTFKSATAFTEEILRAKRAGPVLISDDAFSENCREIRDKVTIAL